MRHAVNICWGAGHLVIVIAIYWGMLEVRKSAIATFGSEATKASWEDWRDDATGANEFVERRRPKSQEPPALVLMRDMFWTCVIAAWIGASVLFFFFMLVVRGILLSEPVVDYSDPKGMTPPGVR